MVSSDFKTVNSRWRDRANQCISQGALTNSKNSKMLIDGLYPTHVKGGHGYHLYDTNDNKYIDYMCGLGANLLGYGNPFVNRAIADALYMGASHSLPTYHEVEAAEELKTLFPCIDLLKFLKTGTDACNASIRIARAMTGRDKILTKGYHGWGDDFVSLTPPGHGAPKGCSELLRDDLSNIDDFTAAVIVEPVETVWNEERRNWLQALRMKCDEHGAVLIFDEVITGFRFEKHSVTEASGVDPDLICLGKAIANGMPLAAVGGKRELMDDSRWFVSSTYAGEVLSLAACKKVIGLLRDSGKYNIDQLWHHGQNFIDTFNSFSSQIKIEGYPSRGVFRGSDQHIALFMQEMAKARIIFCKSWFINFPLLDVQEDVLDICQGVLDKIGRGQVSLQYPIPKSPFSMEVRNG